MDSRLIFSDDALVDLAGISNYTLDRWGERQKIRYMNGLDKSFQAIGKNPQLGKHRAGTPVHIKSIRAEKHIVFYAIEKLHIRIVRVLHERMDFARHLQ